MLPKGWVETKLEDFCDVTAGQSPAGHLINKTGEGLPFFQGKAEFGNDYPNAKNWCSHPPKQAERNDILISVRAPVGPTNYAPETCGIGRGLASVTPLQGIPSAFLRNALRVIEPELKSKATGSTFKAITTKVLKNSKVYLPPLAEQRRIVAKLDSLTPRIARARAELERVRALQKQWLSKFFDTEFSCDGELLTLGELAEDVRYGTAQKCSPDPTLTPVLRIPNIASGKIDTSDLKHSKFTEKEIKKLSLCIGDLLIVRSNGSVDLVGQSAVADARVSGFLFAGYLIRIRLKNKDITPYFVHYWLRSSHARNLINAAAKSTSGVNNINSEQLKNLSIRLPGRLKQREIVSRITKACSHGNRLETETRHALALLDRLESSLLAKAFRGELVPQNPNDEPVSVLLDRIRTERAAAPQPGRKRKA